MQSAKGRHLYKRRSKSIEPFHEWFKRSFELTDRVWHRGLDNNKTQILAIRPFSDEQVEFVRLFADLCFAVFSQW